MKTVQALLTLLLFGGALLTPAAFAAPDADGLTVVYEIKAHTPHAFGNALADVPVSPKTPVDTTDTITVYYKNQSKREDLGGFITLTNYAKKTIITWDTKDAKNKTYTEKQILTKEAFADFPEVAKVQKYIKTFVRPEKQTQIIAGHNTTNIKFTSVSPMDFGVDPDAKTPSGAKVSVPTLTISGEEWRAQNLLPADAALNNDTAEFLAKVAEFPVVLPLKEKLQKINGFPLARTIQITLQFPKTGETAGYAKVFDKESIIFKMRAKSVVVGPLADVLFAPPADYKKAP